MGAFSGTAKEEKNKLFWLANKTHPNTRCTKALRGCNPLEDAEPSRTLLRTRYHNLVLDHKVGHSGDPLSHRGLLPQSGRQFIHPLLVDEVRNCLIRSKGFQAGGDRTQPLNG